MFDHEFIRGPSRPDHGGSPGAGALPRSDPREEGADIVVFDACADDETVPYELASVDDLQGTAKEIEAIGRRCLAVRGDVRDLRALTEAVERTLEELGRLDILVANAGVASYHRVDAMPESAWRSLIDINLTGVF